MFEGLTKLFAKNINSDQDKRSIILRLKWLVGKIFSEMLLSLDLEYYYYVFYILLIKYIVESVFLKLVSKRRSLTYLFIYFVFEYESIN